MNKNHWSSFEEISKDVQILTFDELLQKLVQLKDLLASSDDEQEEVTAEIDVPF